VYDNFKLGLYVNDFGSSTCIRNSNHLHFQPENTARE